MKNWYVAKMVNDFQGLVIDEQTGKNIAVTYDKKDAPLVAAAPELLEACKKVSGGLTDSAVGEIAFKNEDERFGALLLIGHLFKTRGQILSRAISNAGGHE